MTKQACCLGFIWLGAAVHTQDSRAAPRAPSAAAALDKPAVRQRLYEETMDDLMAWAVRLSGLPAAADRPPVFAVTAQVLAEAICPGQARGCLGIVAAYDNKHARVLILDSIDLRDLSGQSFVVHEFVHHLQHRALMTEQAGLNGLTGLVLQEPGAMAAVEAAASGVVTPPVPARTDDCNAVIQAEAQAYAVQNRFLAQHRQLLRVGEALRAIRCPSHDAKEPVFTTLPA